MDQNGNVGQKTAKEKLKFVFEDTVITVFMGIGIVGGVVLSIFPWAPPIVVAILLGMGISSLVYRFLGGIVQSTSITVMGFKLTGTVAVWIACALIINSVLVSQRGITLPENLILAVRNPQAHGRPCDAIVELDDVVIDPTSRGIFPIPLTKSREHHIFVTPRAEEENQDYAEVGNLDDTEEGCLPLVYNPDVPTITLFLKNHE
jgi:hypothetical protein